MFKNIINTLAIIFALGLVGVVQAADNSVIANEFNACTDSADREVTISADGISSTCCSKSLGYCISCGSVTCIKTDYPASRSVLDNLRPNTATPTEIAPITPKPPSLRDQMKPQATTSSPAKAVDNAAPTPEPIRQQMKVSPTTPDKAISK
ncbi:hypothetical protein MNBD_GAMMA26-1871 [hydrothermal vent metagenome]|uniref:Uncharacterized protein n=1 Tax=hydrothermal vent metagenome TaxID=652676 RepID=A0A3B1ATN2_9ZZZZ